MTLQEFTSEMTKRGCTTDGNTFCGTFEGYPFAVTYQRGTATGATAFNLRLLFNSKIPRSMYKNIKKEMKGAAKVQPGAQNQNAYVYGAVLGGAVGAAIAGSTAGAATVPQMYSVIVTVARNGAVGPAFDKLVQLVSAEAKANLLAPPEHCALCRQPSPDAYAYHGTAYQPVHTACVQQHHETAQVKLQQNQKNGNYPFGILGAILGAVVGAIPTILLLVFANYIVALLCALIPLCSYFGYKLFGGKMTKVAVLIVILCSLLMIPVVDYGVETFYFYQDTGILLPIAFYIQVLMLSPADFIPAYLQMLLFVGLGILIVWGVISRNTAGEVAATAGFSASTLRPMEGAAAAPPTAAPAAAPLAAVAAPAEPVAAPSAPAVAPASAVSSQLPAGMRDEAPALTAEPPAGPDIL